MEDIELEDYALYVGEILNQKYPINGGYSVQGTVIHSKSGSFKVKRSYYEVLEPEETAIKAFKALK